MVTFYLIVAVFLLVILLGAVVIWQMRLRWEAEQEKEKAESYAETRQALDDAVNLGNDPDAARRWLSERDPNQP